MQSKTSRDNEYRDQTQYVKRPVRRHALVSFHASGYDPRDPRREQSVEIGARLKLQSCGYHVQRGAKEPRLNWATGRRSKGMARVIRIPPRALDRAMNARRLHQYGKSNGEARCGAFNGTEGDQAPS